MAPKKRSGVGPYKVTEQTTERANAYYCIRIN